ncbi:glycoside hydrolase family 61 protein [Lasiosphaeria miniovina]|uniref:lytic cellulose monooxygenase (C4-dehydrogenating) n=2 Tax=Lasiosphaeria TaxID=92901 RepID=A0AA40DQ64_9PEZI|nr:glycoside hydrolase family 61 protein [Lasiosphaeria miniovina]KAK0709386.1 glycoside hydrolase family 61 protein [Lasiosphaeria miniovina]KAK3375742.1 family 61 glycosyl hydrolase [Lasiosphaeria ovina]
MKVSAVLAGIASASVASGHTIFLSLTTDKSYGISYGIRTPSYDGPQTDVNAKNMACNGAPNPTTPSDKIIPVTAGTNVSAVWRHTLQSGANDVMDPGHKGPVMAYLKKVTDAKTDSGVGDGWFKIQEGGYKNGQWATNEVINNKGNQVIRIPSCIANGQYLLRAEMVALHGARSVNGAQLYMECAQIEITGGSGTASPKTYSIPGIYKSNDPGLLIDIYSMKTTTSYVIPGPPLFTCP